jgi:hypothetical protein
MPLNDAVSRGLEMGRAQTEQRVRPALTRRAGDRTFQGHLILEGDSWFSYPVYDEVTEVLRDEFNYNTRNAAHQGDTAQEIAYLPGQLSHFASLFEDLVADKHVARAILLSCGGNDVMDALAALMNPKGSGGAVWHPAVVQAVIHEQVPLAIAALVGRAVALSEQHFRQRRPVLVHGYGNPVPDGRGFKFVATLAGPWMKPVFVRKGRASVEDDEIVEELQANANAIEELMAIFNDTILPGLAATANQQFGAEVVHYVDVRGVLSSHLEDDDYRNDWANELHPTGKGFQKVARAIDEAIRRAAPVIPPPLP